MKHFFKNIDLLKLYLVCAFPIHVWWIYMIFRDIGWIAERTNTWDSLGFSAYSLVYAFIESAFIFLILMAASFFLPMTWSKEKRINVLSVVVFGATFWFIVEQVVLIFGPSRLQPFFNIFLSLSNPLLIINALVTIAVLASFSIPIFLIIRFETLDSALTLIFERLILLSGLYIFVDLLSLIIILYRNLNS